MPHQQSREMIEIEKITEVVVINDAPTTNTTTNANHATPPTLLSQTREVVLGSKLNVLYLCIPIAFISGMNDGPGGLTFASSFFALIPLAALLGDLTEDLAEKTHDAIGALINVTFGNITEVIVSIAALRLKQYDLVQMTMLGSVFGNMLLVLGSSLLLAGLKWPMLNYNGDAVKTYVSLLLLGCMNTVIPTALSTLSAESGTLSAAKNVSVHTSIVMILVYGMFLFYQLRTHKAMFDGDATPKVSSSSAEEGNHEETTLDDGEEKEGPKFTFAFAFVVIGGVAVLISLLSDYLVDTVEVAAETFHLSRHFIGLIIIPIVGNVAEHASAILMAAKGKINISFGVALGSAIQIQMFAFPLMAVASWVLGLDMTMNVTPFLASTLFVCVVVTYSCCYDSCATWIQGAKLLSAYVLLCLAFLDTPDPADLSTSRIAAATI